MAHRIRVVVTCTQSKSAPAMDGLLARSLATNGSTTERCREWLKRMPQRRAGRVRVRDLYSGDHWVVALDLEGASRAGDVELWVASAGYGLLALDDCIASYGASFRTGDEDAVASTSTGASEWWSALARATPPGVTQHPRSLVELAHDDPEASLLVVASPPYLAAMSSDICDAADKLEDSDRLVVISAGAKSGVGRAARHLLDVDARVQAHVGGSMLSLNVRVARDLLKRRQKPGLSLKAAQRSFGKLMSETDEFLYPQRRRLEDEEVIAFIAKGLRKDPAATRSRLLRALRDSGHACEQSRFGRLFNGARVTLYD